MDSVKLKATLFIIYTTITITLSNAYSSSYYLYLFKCVNCLCLLYFRFFLFLYFKLYEGVLNKVSFNWIYFKLNYICFFLFFTNKWKLNYNKNIRWSGLTVLLVTIKFVRPRPQWILYTSLAQLCEKTLVTAVGKKKWIHYKLVSCQNNQTHTLKIK